MITVKAPATSANLGPGFDILGIALSLYNTYKVELSDKLIIENVDEKFATKDNSFVAAFDAVCKKLGSDKTCHVVFDSIDIPFCRGLGSSAALIAAGAVSANYLLGNKLTEAEVFKTCIYFENHPDNISPCLHGGLTINMMVVDKNETYPVYRKINLSNDVHFTVIIPDYEVKTEDARKVLKSEVSLKDSIFNTSHSLMLIKALETGDFDLLKFACDDKLHVPYRMHLIKDYENIRKKCMDAGAAAFTISGSGSTMLVISKYDNFSQKLALDNSYKIYDLNVDNEGVKCL